MRKVLAYTKLQWFLLVIISASVTFTTLHSHHPWKWHQSDQPVHNTHNLTKDSNLCPVSGYLYHAQIAHHKTPQDPVQVATFSTLHRQSQCIDPYTGFNTGRSPPLAG